MTKPQIFSSSFCFFMLILGAVSLLSGNKELGIYCNTLVIALQSILICQQVILRNHDKYREDR